MLARTSMISNTPQNLNFRELFVFLTNRTNFRYFIGLFQKFKVTFNSDWLAVCWNSRVVHGILLKDEIGLSTQRDIEKKFYCSLTHPTWMSSVGSYLPQGSQDLKEVTRKKLKYLPLKIDPEEMVKKVMMYYLFQKYVQPFIFSCVLYCLWIRTIRWERERERCADHCWWYKPLKETLFFQIKRRWVLQRSSDHFRHLRWWSRGGSPIGSIPQRSFVQYRSGIM